MLSNSLSFVNSVGGTLVFNRLTPGKSIYRFAEATPDEPLDFELKSLVADGKKYDSYATYTMAENALDENAPDHQFRVSIRVSYPSRIWTPANAAAQVDNAFRLYNLVLPDLQKGNM